jgi:hypothetical protein
MQDMVPQSFQKDTTVTRNLSGQVEAQCKNLVGARCKQAGMRNWTYAGAVGILRLRAAKQDGSFDVLWDRRLELPRAA